MSDDNKKFAQTDIDAAVRLALDSYERGRTPQQGPTAGPNLLDSNDLSGLHAAVAERTRNNLRDYPPFKALFGIAPKNLYTQVPEGHLPILTRGCIEFQWKTRGHGTARDRAVACGFSDYGPVVGYQADDRGVIATRVFIAMQRGEGRLTEALVARANRRSIDDAVSGNFSRSELDGAEKVDRQKSDHLVATDSYQSMIRALIGQEWAGLARACWGGNGFLLLVTEGLVVPDYHLVWGPNGELLHGRIDAEPPFPTKDVYKLPLPTAPAEAPQAPPQGFAAEDAVERKATRVDRKVGLG